MGRTQKRKIDFAILLLSGVLLCFSAYCWTNVLRQGMTALFPAVSEPAQTDQSKIEIATENATENMTENVTEIEADGVQMQNEDEVSVETASLEVPADRVPFEDTAAQVEEEESTGEGLLQGLDDLTGRIDNFWYVNVCRENEWSGMDSAVTYTVTGEISSSQVLLGKEGWLFYKSVFDNDPIGDYDGTKQFTQDELEMMGQGVLHVQNALKERGIRFTVLLCPNKENVYAAYMPENYVHAEKSRTDLLAVYLEKEGVSVVNLKEDMVRQSADYPLYYSYDTHWNQLGGYVGTENLLRSWGITIPPLNERKILSTRLWDCANRECTDDLAELSRLQFVFDDEREHVVEGTFPVNWSGIESEEYLRFENPNAAREDKVLLVGDSFRRAMLPSLCEEFREVYVIHRKNFEAGMLDEIATDYVIAEYVERYSGEIQEIESLFF